MAEDRSEPVSADDWAQGVGPGWRPIVREAIKKIEALGGRITQVKEKFGGLRIYYRTNLQSIHEPISLILRQAESECDKICEVCGQPGAKKRQLKGWVKTVCPFHEDVKNWPRRNE